MVHHLAFDDRGVGQRRHHDLHELGRAARVIDDDRFDEARSDIETDGQLLATEERHGLGGYAVVITVAPDASTRRDGTSTTTCSFRSIHSTNDRRPAR